MKDIRDEHSLFAKKMMDAGVSYVSNGKGRGAKSYIGSSRKWDPKGRPAGWWRLQQSLLPKR